MASFTITSTNYGGEDVKGFVSSTLLENDTVERDLLTVHENVKKKQSIKIVDDEVKLVNPSADFTDQGTTADHSEKSLDPVRMEFMKEESWENLINSWYARDLAPGEMQNYDGVVDLTDHLVNRYKKKLSIAHHRLMWLGKAAVQEASGLTAYTGLLPKLVAGSDVFKTKLTGFQLSITSVSASGLVTHAAPAGTFRDGDVVTITSLTGGPTLETTLTIYGGANSQTIVGQSYIITGCTATTFQLYMNVSRAQTKRTVASFSTASTGGTMQFVNVSNVSTFLASVYAQMDYTAYNNEGAFNVMIPIHIAKAWATKQGELANQSLGALAVKKTIAYNDINLQVMPFFPGNTVLIAEKKNLHLGTDLLSDENSLETVDLRPSILVQKVRIKAGMASDVNYFNGPEIGLWYPSV